MTPPKVLFVSSHSLDGGSEAYLLGLLEALGAPWIAGVVCLEHGTLVDRLQKRGIGAEVIRTSGSPAQICASAWKLGRLVQRLRPDVVHANGIKAALVAALAPVSGVPIIWVKHDFSWDGVLARLIAHRCEQIVGVTRAVTGMFSEKHRSRIHVVLPGIPKPLEVERSAARVRARELFRSLPDTGQVTILVGRLEPTKGQRELIEIAPAVRMRRPEARFLLVGAESPSCPTFRRELEARVRELGLDEYIEFAGYRPDAVTLIAGSDAIAVPSVSARDDSKVEGAGLTAIEAMAVGTPVVGYAVGGVPEVVGKCGLLVQPRDREALAHALVRVLEDRDLRETSVRCGLARARSVFTIERMTAQMKQRYSEAAGSARDSAR